MQALILQIDRVAGLFNFETEIKALIRLDCHHQRIGMQRRGAGFLK